MKLHRVLIGAALCGAVLFSSCTTLASFKDPAPLKDEDKGVWNSVVFSQVKEAGQTIKGAGIIAEYAEHLLMKRGLGEFDQSPWGYRPEKFREFYGNDVRHLGLFYRKIFRVFDWDLPIDIDMERELVVVACEDGVLFIPIIPGERRGC